MNTAGAPGEAPGVSARGRLARSHVCIGGKCGIEKIMAIRKVQAESAAPRKKLSRVINHTSKDVRLWGGTRECREGVITVGDGVDRPRCTSACRDYLAALRFEVRDSPVLLAPAALFTIYTFEF